MLLHTNPTRERGEYLGTRMLLHTNPTRERGEYLGTRAGASEDM